jgi:hypothetical protein
MPESPQGEWPEKDEVSKDLLPLLQNPSQSVSVLPSGNMRRWVEIRVKTLPWNVWIETLKRDLIETMELS